MHLETNNLKVNALKKIIHQLYFLHWENSYLTTSEKAKYNKFPIQYTKSSFRRERLKEEVFFSGYLKFPNANAYILQRNKSDWTRVGKQEIK